MAKENINTEKIEAKTSEKTILENKKIGIENNPNSFVDAKLTELQSWINKLPNKTAKKEGNITMREYLINVKKNIEDNKSFWIEKEKTNMNNNIQNLDTEIINLNLGVDDGS